MSDQKTPSRQEWGLDHFLTPLREDVKLAMTLTTHEPLSQWDSNPSGGVQVVKLPPIYLGILV